MRKVWLTAIAATAFVLVSCAASGPHVDAFKRAEAAYNNGKDDKAIEEALKALKIKPDYQPAIDFLNKTFDDVIAAKNDTIAMFKKRDDPNPKRWDKIVYMEERKAEYAKQLKLIARRNDKLKLSVDVDPNDIKVARDSAAASHYAAGLEKMNERGKAAQQVAAVHFRKAFTYHADYEDSKQLYAECKKRGTIRVAVDPFNNDYSGRMDAALIAELQKNKEASEFLQFLTRADLDRVLEEQTLSSSGDFQNSEGEDMMGKLRSAEFLIAGSIEKYVCSDDEKGVERDRQEKENSARVKIGSHQECEIMKNGKRRCYNVSDYDNVYATIITDSLTKKASTSGAIQILDFATGEIKKKADVRVGVLSSGIVAGCSGDPRAFKPICKHTEITLRSCSEMADQMTVDFARKAVKEIIGFTKSFLK
jgi:tetratricopeptide (TPR) repeat protein